MVQSYATPNARPAEVGRQSYLPARYLPWWAPALVEGSAVLFLLALLYKIDLLGIAAMLSLTASGIILPKAWARIPNKFLVGSATAYLFMATATAGMYDLSAGLYRSVHFVLLSGAAYGFANYLALTGEADRYRLMKLLAILFAVVLAHVVVYHVLTRRLSPMKYLSDTKTIFSFAPIVLFALEERIRRSIGTILWFAVIAATGLLVILSGERKAYMLLAALFLLSKSSMTEKVLSIMAGASVLVAYVAASDGNNYIVQQVTSLFHADRELQISEYYMIDNIGDYSNIIRDFVNRMATDLFHQNPVLGLGSGGYWRWAHANFLGPDRGLAMNVHGEINRIPVEGGIVGIVVAIALLASLTLRTVELELRSWHASSRVSTRLPAYMLSFMVFYTWVEALDTLMLALIVGTAYCMAIVGPPRDQTL